MNTLPVTPEENAFLDYLATGDGSVLVEGATCARCGLHVTVFHGLWWSADDDPMCPDGEHLHLPDLERMP